MLPLDEVKKEMTKAKNAPTTHTPSTYNAWLYFVWGKAIP